MLAQVDAFKTQDHRNPSPDGVYQVKKVQIISLSLELVDNLYII